jgi:hypothetical protein
MVFCSTLVYSQGFPICDGPGNQGDPNLVLVGNEYYVVVYDSIGDIWAARLDLEGNIIDRFRVHQHSPFSDADTLPRVATNGERWFVIWTEVLYWPVERFLGIEGAIYEGATPIVEPFLIPGGTCYPAISCNGEFFLVTATTVVPEIPQKAELFGAVYDEDGYAQTVFTVDRAGGMQQGEDGCIGHSMVGSDGDNFIVSYPWCQSSMAPPYPTTHEIRHAIATADGNVNVFILYQETTNDYTVPGAFSQLTHPKLYRLPSSTAFNGNNHFCSYHILEDYSVLPFEGVYDVFGALIEPDGDIVLNEIPIATQPIIFDEYAPAVTAEDREFFVVWQENPTGDYDIFGRRYLPNGSAVSDKFIVTDADYEQSLPAIAFDGLNSFIVWQDYRNGAHWDIWGNLLPKSGFWNNDPLALAYNGNRHLARQPNSENLHLVYTDRGKVIYRHSTNGGADWTLPEVIGDGKFPAIALSSNYLPAVIWTDDIGALWYAKKTAACDWEVYQLYHPIGPYDPFLSSPPSIAIIPTGLEDLHRDVVHVLTTFTSRIDVNGVIHSVQECWFPLPFPQDREFVLIEQCQAPTYPPQRSFPSIVMDYERRLHGVWQRGDTICYATKEVGLPWNNWGPQFGDDGLQSAHPMVECYGDMVYVVWQKEEDFSGYKEVYKGWRQLTIPFDWTNFSQTPYTPSLYPVNASGIFTVWSDMLGPPNHNFEIYYKTTPGEPPINISQTLLKSIYSHSAARFTGANSYLYTAWLEGEGVPYEIRFKKIRYIPMEVPYLTAINGYETPSPYLVARDSFISTWQVPVDIGYETITYQFPLESGYRYKLKVVAYHQSSGEWKEWCIIDGKMKHQIKYNAYEPETLEFWVPPAFYKDGVIEVVFDRITGDFATGGPFWVYRYECEEGGEGGGPMAQEGYPVEETYFTVSPNPFNRLLNIRLQAQTGNTVNVKVYDVSGRLVKRLFEGILENTQVVNWDGCDENGRAIPQGVYFLEFETSDTKETVCHKIIKVE